MIDSIENPQTVYWRDKYTETASLCNAQRIRIESQERSIHFLNQRNLYLADKLHEANVDKRRFNALPWYKKICYIFKIERYD